MAHEQVLAATPFFENAPTQVLSTIGSAGTVRDLVRGDDGLFHMIDGNGLPQAAPGVRLMSGALEGSNVNAVDAMVSMIANARRYEMQMRTLQTAETNAQQANKLLSAR